jgi:hypothetical protein
MALRDCAALYRALFPPALMPSASQAALRLLHFVPALRVTCARREDMLQPFLFWLALPAPCKVDHVPRSYTVELEMRHKLAVAGP